LALPGSQIPLIDLGCNIKGTKSQDYSANDTEP
jgi:hypothetical protein